MRRTDEIGSACPTSHEQAAQHRQGAVVLDPARDLVGRRAHRLGGVAHRDAAGRPAQHLDVVAAVADRHGRVGLHTEVLAQRYINDYVRENFAILQLDLWGAREVTDFDGTVLTERALAERWGVIFTPTIAFFKDDLAGLDGKWGRELEAIERLPLSYGRDTFYDLFVWVRLKLYERDRNFQRFHISRIAEREALKSGTAADKGARTN